MTREEAKQLLPVIKAFAEGKTIEYQAPDGVWCAATRSRLNVGFDQGAERYRIKPEPKYRPFENDKECWAEMLKHQPFGWVDFNGIKGCISHISEIYIIDDSSRTIYFDPQSAEEEEGFSMPWALASYTFADGHPFGVKVEEDE